MAGAFHFSASDIDDMDDEDVRFWTDRVADWGRLAKQQGT